MSDVIQGEQPSQEELFYKRWGWETLKENISVLNGVLKMFISLDAAILAAYLGLHDKVTINPSAKIALSVLLLVSLCASIAGVYPIPAKVNLNKPAAIRSYKLKRVRFKKICLLVASGTLIGGFIVLLAALVSNS